MSDGNADVVTACAPNAGRCTSFLAGHNTHTVRSTLAGRAPRGWYDAVVEEIHGLAITLDIGGTQTALVWHHRPLAPKLAAGDRVRVHLPQALLELGSTWLSIVLSEVRDAEGEQRTS